MENNIKTKTNIFVNLPVKELEKSKTFFSNLGYKFNPQFTDENAACMIIDENIYAMLIVEMYFKTFMSKEITDTKKNCEVITALSTESRAKVDELVNSAIKAGAIEYREATDLGFMYTRSFQDLDGHLWEYFFIEPSHIK